MYVNLDGSEEDAAVIEFRVPGAETAQAVNSERACTRPLIRSGRANARVRSSSTLTPT